MLGEGGATGTVSPEVIASALTFRADAGNLVPEINAAVVTDALGFPAGGVERPGRDASLDFSSGRPVVVPSQDGRGVDYEVSLAPLLYVLTGTGEREITAVYGDQPAELTTEELNALGITGVVGEFTTGGRRRLGPQHQAGRGADQRDDREARLDVQPQPGHRSAQREQRLRRGRHHLRLGTPRAGSAAASPRSPPRCTTRRTSRGWSTCRTRSTASTSAATPPVAKPPSSRAPST